ncbi:MAG: 1-deoxy-D-xylulose-5-phosphate reductoisomerase [Deltaproteobacteria bacterium]|jgi:1-deoxy-D-xylulose-5-phosphate reductoisomerase|nr:1-deoxy-D-xylulose-5-phosphate reductoisomerase [Deltaproteobacteria bacterium]
MSGTKDFPMKIAVLGSTGSIGSSALSLAYAFKDKIEVVALSGHSKLSVLADQIRCFKPGLVAVPGENAREYLLSKLNGSGASPQIVLGPEGLVEAAVSSGADTVLSAIVGAAGLRPTFAAIKKGLKVALANKESLVLGGELIMPLADGLLSPVDSEHSAIFQALGGKLKNPELKKIILTASGGPFYGLTIKDLKEVTVEKALKHPTWSMGPKITCDSATLMNKGLEVIEAHHLFGLSYDKIEIVVHPGSHIHSLCEFIDGSILAQLGPTDMRLAISYALSHPLRWPLLDLKDRLPEVAKGPYQPRDFSDFEPISLSKSLEFYPPDRMTFPALALAEAAGQAGGTAPAILNGANEEAVAAFLAGLIPFTGISATVAHALDAIPTEPLTSIDQALDVNDQAREQASQYIRSRTP